MLSRPNGLGFFFPETANIVIMFFVIGSVFFGHFSHLAFTAKGRATRIYVIKTQATAITAKIKGLPATGQ
jgi:hypothetical protein